MYNNQYSWKKEIEKMELTPKISILIPCYNVEKYVSTCLDSIINQTFCDIEIICVNDGSTDSTYSVLCEYKKKDRRIKIINKLNTGYGDSMNIAIDNAKGEYIGIVESDDFIEENMYETLYQIAKKNKTEITRCCYYKLNGNVNTYIAYDDVPKNEVVNPCLERNIFWQDPSIWAAIYKKDWINKNGIKFLKTPGASYQDTSFSFKCYALCTRFIMTDKAFVHYRVDNPTSSINSKDKAYSVCKEWKEIYRFIRADKKLVHLLDIAQNLEFCTYAWNFKRLRGSLKYKFIIRWIYEIILHLFKGEINIKKYDVRILKKIKKNIGKKYK